MDSCLNEILAQQNNKHAMKSRGNRRYLTLQKEYVITRSNTVDFQLVLFQLTELGIDKSNKRISSRFLCLD